MHPPSWLTSSWACFGSTTSLQQHLAGELLECHLACIACRCLQPECWKCDHATAPSHLPACPRCTCSGKQLDEAAKSMANYYQGRQNIKSGPVIAKHVQAWRADGWTPSDAYNPERASDVKSLMAKVRGRGLLRLYRFKDSLNAAALGVHLSRFSLHPAPGPPVLPWQLA